MVSGQLRRIAAGLAVAALALVAGPAATAAESPVVQYNAADQAVARALVLRLGDLGAGWKGGSKKPDPAATSPCESWNPRQADLVVTGAAESQFTYAGALFLTSTSLVYRTPRMALLDWQRTVTHPDAVRCLRSSLARGSGLRLVSFGRTSFARLAPYATRFRAVLGPASGAASERVLADIVLVGRGRHTLGLMLVAPYAEQAAATTAETRLARLLVSRIPA